MKNPIRETLETMRSLTEEGAERNIYCHPNPLARDIFWQRLEILAQGIKLHVEDPRIAIDFGGGSGAFLRGLSHLFEKVEIIDWDPDDARRLQAFHKIENVDIHQGSIQDWAPESPRDAVIATDVLEHFQDLEVPISRIKEYLKPNGFLCFSVPTENWIYLLGRKLVRKTKPADHYHPAKTIVETLKRHGFSPVWEQYAPNYLGVGIPLFHLGIYRKK